MNTTHYSLIAKYFTFILICGLVESAIGSDYQRPSNTPPPPVLNNTPGTTYPYQNSLHPQTVFVQIPPPPTTSNIQFSRSMHDTVTTAFDVNNISSVQCIMNGTVTIQLTLTQQKKFKEEILKNTSVTTPPNQDTNGTLQATPFISFLEEIGLVRLVSKTNADRINRIMFNNTLYNKDSFLHMFNALTSLECVTISTQSENNKNDIYFDITTVANSIIEDCKLNKRIFNVNAFEKHNPSILLSNNVHLSGKNAKEFSNALKEVLNEDIFSDVNSTAYILKTEKLEDFFNKHQSFFKRYSTHFFWGG